MGMGIGVMLLFAGWEPSVGEGDLGRFPGRERAAWVYEEKAAQEYWWMEHRRLRFTDEVAVGAGPDPERLDWERAVWWNLYEAYGKYRPSTPQERRERLARLRALLGCDRYWRGEMPGE